MDVNNSTTLGAVKVIMLKGEKGDSGNIGDYAELVNLPKINNVTIIGNKTPNDFLIPSMTDFNDLDAAAWQYEGVLSSTDLNTVTQQGVYVVNSGTNLPDGVSGGVLMVYNGSSGTVILQKICTGTTAGSYREYARRYSGGEWLEWIMVGRDVSALNTGSTSLSVTYGSITTSLTVYKRRGMVYLPITIGENGTPFSTVTGFDTIGTLPEGYRPPARGYFPATAKNNGAWASGSTTYAEAAISVETNGAVSILGNVTTLQGMAYITGVVSFPVD